MFKTLSIAILQYEKKNFPMVICIANKLLSNSFGSITVVKHVFKS